MFLISRQKVAVRLKKGVRKVTVSGKACPGVDKGKRPKEKKAVLMLS